MNEPTPEERFLDERIETICDGLREGIRREVARLHASHLPVYVVKNGSVVVEEPPSTEPESE